MNSFTLCLSAARRCVWENRFKANRTFIWLYSPAPLCEILPPTAAANGVSVKNRRRGVYPVTYHPVLSLLGVTCQKVTFQLLVAAHSSLCAPLLGLPGNYSRRDGATSARKLLISMMSCSQLIQETLGFAYVQKRRSALGGTESIKAGGDPLSPKGGSVLE